MIEHDVERALRGRYADRSETAVPPTLVQFVAAIPSTAVVDRRTRWGLRRSTTGSARVPRFAIFAGAALAAMMIVGALFVASQPARVPLIPADHGVFTRTGSTIRDRAEGIGAIQLPDDRVLIVGGYGSGEASAELWDPTDGVFRSAGSLAEGGRFGSAATLLPDGKVLVTFTDAVGMTTAEAWDPTTDVFTAMSSLGSGDWMQSATPLRDGRVLVLGGAGDGSPSPSAYLVDPMSHVANPVELPQGPAGEGATPVASVGAALLRILANDHVLLVAVDGSAQVWDPLTGTSAPTALLAFGPGEDPLSATLLSDGRVLIVSAKGYHRDGSDATSTAQVWDPTTGSASRTGPFRDPGTAFGSATLLADGRVLVAGGRAPCLDSAGKRYWCSEVRYLTSAELWDPATGAFEVTGSLTTPRSESQSMTLLRDGRVLVVGGFGIHDGSAELFELKP